MRKNQEVQHQYHDANRKERNVKLSPSESQIDELRHITCMECAGLHCPCISLPIQNRSRMPVEEWRECENPNYPREGPQTYKYKYKNCAYISEYNMLKDLPDLFSCQGP